MNDEDLIDFYAGLAMSALIAKDSDMDIEEIAGFAFDIALAMINTKLKRKGYDD